MPDNEYVLVDDEIQRLRKARDLRRAIALAALALVFVALIPSRWSFGRN
jgi:hypothetical protein